MNNSFRQDNTNVPRPASFLVKLPDVSNLFKWLANQIKLTEEEQDDAGVYLGGEGRDERDSQER